MKEPRRWLVMCLQKHKLTPDSNNKAGRAAKTLRSTVSTWQVTEWLGLLPDFSLYSLLSHPNPHWYWPGEMWEKQTATNCNIRDGAADLQASAASSQDMLSLTDREGVTDGAEQSLEDWGTSLPSLSSHHSSLQQVLPPHGHSSRPVLKTHISKSHTLGKTVPTAILVWEPRNPILASYLRETLKHEVHILEKISSTFLH